MNIENQNTTEIQPEVVATENEVTTPIEEGKNEVVAESVAPKTSSIEKMIAKSKTLVDDVAPKAKEPKEALPETVKPVVETEIPTYVPDFKYKANGKVKEIDERLRPLIKDKETEEWVKSTLSKADGLEEVLSHREHYRNQFNTLNAQASEVLAEVSKKNYGLALQKLGVDTSNINEVMTGLGFKKEDIIKHAYNLAQLTPEQEQAYAKEREREVLMAQQQGYVEQLNQRLYQQEVQLKTSELKTVLSTPDYAPLVEAFDQKNGQGAFWDEVCRRGEYYDLKGMQKGVLDLVNEVGSIAKLLSPQQQAPTPMATPATNQQQNKPTVVPVIPNVGGGSTSPARKKPRSVDQLREYGMSLSDD